MTEFAYCFLLFWSFCFMCFEATLIRYIYIYNDSRCLVYRSSYYCEIPSTSRSDVSFCLTLIYTSRCFSFLVVSVLPAQLSFLLSFSFPSRNPSLLPFLWGEASFSKLPRLVLWSSWISLSDSWDFRCRTIMMAGPFTFQHISALPLRWVHWDWAVS